MSELILVAPGARRMNKDSEKSETVEKVITEAPEAEGLAEHRHETVPRSPLGWGIGSRLLWVAAAIGLLWLAVAWALGWLG